MLNYAEVAPVVASGFEGGDAAIPTLVDDVLDQQQAWFRDGLGNPEAIELLGLALNEVLHSIVEFSGIQQADFNSGVKLWVDRSLVILSVHFQGRPLPEWLATNWDRGQEPAVLAPPHDIGWGWLLVREALDSVHHTTSGTHQTLFLEKRF